MTERELKLLQQMAREYPTVQAASAEIINLTAILNLPKGTEHFMSDIHAPWRKRYKARWGTALP